MQYSYQPLETPNAPMRATKRVQFFAFTSLIGAMLGTIWMFVAAGLAVKKFEIHLIGYVVFYCSLCLGPAILTAMSTRLQQAKVGLGVGAIILGIPGIFVYSFVLTEAIFALCEGAKAFRLVGTIGLAQLLLFEVIVVLTSAFEIRRARTQKKQRETPQALPMSQVFAPPQYYPYMFVPQYMVPMAQPKMV